MFMSLEDQSVSSKMLRPSMNGLWTICWSTSPPGRMSDPLFDADDASTPLTADQKQGLIPSHITQAP
jgi:hypothetical protein